MSRSAYDELRDAVISGRVPPGTPLIETALANQYGVSRTPIREALMKLRQDGLVESNGRGLAVRLQSPEEILEIYEVRVLLEVHAARAAARSRSELDLNRLVRLQHQMAETPAEDVEARVRRNSAFHEQVWTASHNRTLRDLLDRISVQLRRYPETTLTYPGRWEVAIADHDALIEAIRTRDTDEAAQVAGRHMSSARDIRLQMYTEH